MSGVTLDDIANDETMKEPIPVEVPGEYDLEVVDNNRRNELLKKLLTAETGSGSLDSYIDHPMNFNGSRSLARILRGLTGLIGNLNLAIIDIGLGVLEFSKEKGKQHGIDSGNTNYY